MQTNNTELKKVLNNLVGDYEALSLDLHDILRMVKNPKIVEIEINDLKKSLANALKSRDNMLNKLGIQSEEK